MISEERIEEIKCAFSDEEHFLIKPISLLCGHSICQNCIPAACTVEIRCKICDLVSKQDLTEPSISKLAQESVNFCMVDIFQILEKETKDRLNELKYKIENKEDFSSVAFDYIEEEIDIRVESVKIQLDEASIRVKETVKKTKIEYLNLLDNRNAKLNDLDSSLKEFRENIKNRINLNEDYLNSYQKKIKELKTLLIEMDDSKIPFLKISTKKIEDNDVIGQIISMNKNNHYNIQNLLKMEKKEYVRLDYRPFNLTVLSNNTLVGFNFMNDFNKCITIHNESFAVIKKVYQINNESINYISETATNYEKKELYLLEESKNRIIVTDFELNFIEYFGSKFRKDFNFKSPTGICFKNGVLYVCDTYNKRIQVFNQNFKFIQSLKLQYIPDKVKASNSTLAVKSYDEVNFYDLNGLNLIRTFHHCLNIYEIDSSFYGFDYVTNKFYVFDDTGNFIENFEINEIGKNGSDLVLFNECVLMNSGKNIIKFQ